jgi:hypothetical protein
MARKEGDKVFILMIILVVVAIAAFVFFGAKDTITLLGDPGSEEIPESPVEEEGEKALFEGEEGVVEETKEGGDGGGGGGGGGGSEGDPGSDSSTENKIEIDEGDPEGTLHLYDIGYTIVESDLVIVDSISYGVYNLNMGPMSLELLVYIYGEDDDDSDKGLVREQIQIGQLGVGQKLEETIDISAYYRGDLSGDKTFKLTLIGYYVDKSYNLGSVSTTVIFS